MEADLKTQRLNKIASEVAYQRQMDRARSEEQELAWLPVKDSTPVARLDFWCDRCAVDFTGNGRRVVYSQKGAPIAFYAARCPSCAAFCRRRITDKLRDPYYLRSRKILRARAKAVVDTLQPEMWGYKTYWRQSLDSFVAAQVEKEKAVHEKYDNPAERLYRSFKMKRELKHADYREHGRL